MRVTARPGLTRAETLILGAAIALAALLLFPIIVAARERSRLASCQTNLRAVGSAVLMYMDDYDQTAPLARSVEIDAPPLVREGGAGESPFVLTGGMALLSPALGDCPPLRRPGLWPLHLVLDSYVSHPDVWRDPEDAGDTTVGYPPKGGWTPSAYAAYGSSYQYHQGLIWKTKPEPDSAALRTSAAGRLAPVRRPELPRPAETPLVFDGEGYWHGATTAHEEPDPYLAATRSRGYNVFFADGRAGYTRAPALLNRAPGRPLGLLYRDARE